MRRRRLWLGLVLFFAAVVFVVLGWVADFQWPRSPQVKAERFDSVRLGMTYEKVLMMVGGPSGDYRTDERIQPLRGFWRGGPVVRLEHWLCDDGEVFIALDENDRVTNMGFGRMVDMRPNRLRWFTRQFGN